MFKNYLKTALRNLSRQRGTAFVNVLGLMLGISGSIILFLLLSHILTFDKFQENYDRIYRVVSEDEGNDGKNYSGGVPSPLPVAFRNDFPEAKEVAFTSYQAGGLILIPLANDEFKKFQEESGIVYTEPSLFKIFTIPAIIGDPVSGIGKPNEAVLSRSQALKYFGKEDAVGEVISYDKKDFKVTAIVEDPKDNSDFPFTVFLSYQTVRKEIEAHGWGSTWSDENCYFLLKEGLDVKEVNQRMAAFTDKYIGKENHSHRLYMTQPLSTIHYDDRFGSYTYNTTNVGTILALIVIAVFLVLTACINFINLATAEAIKRSKEVGIRKTLGSQKSQLVAQFLGETALVTFVAILLSLGLTQIALSFLNPFMDLQLGLDLLHDWKLMGFIGVTFILVSLLSGLYPAFILSGYNPVLALKNQISSRSSSGYFMRKSLVVFQFFISQLFIIATIVIISQMNYFNTVELGFRKDAIITIPIPESETVQENDSLHGGSKMKTLKQQISNLAGVELVSLCNTPPSSNSVSSTGFLLEGESDDQYKATHIKTVDENYIDLFDLKMLAGAGLNESDTATGYVVNRKFTEVAGFATPQEMVGKRIRIWRRVYPVVGVVENFNTTSLHNDLEPTVLLNSLRNYYTMAIQISPSAVKTTVPQIEKLWNEAYARDIFSYSFLDDSIKEFYEGEQKMSVLLSLFTGLAIFIGCLGLFGLVSFMANQKTKEIGVRKVLGASVNSIVFMFTKEFGMLILIGFVIAVPCAWYVMDAWLNEFAYKIPLGPTIFLSSLVITFALAMITVGYKSFQAATSNPAESLKSE